MDVVAEERPLQLVEEQDQAIGEQDLGEVVAAIESRDGEALHRPAEGEHHRHAEQHRPDQSAGALRQPPGEICPQHVEGAVREIEDAEHAKDQRQAARAGGLQAVDD